MPLTLGTRPDRLTVELVDDAADFSAGLTPKTGTWTGTMVLTLLFNDTNATVWTATVTDNVAWFTVDKVAAAALRARLQAVSKPTAKLIYNDGTADAVWARGTVVLQ